MKKPLSRGSGITATSVETLFRFARGGEGHDIRKRQFLLPTGIQVFELVYHEMRANPGRDEIKLNQYVAKDHGISDRSYQRGVRELLEKEFLYRSPSDGVFFVNIRFMFNGDRLAFVKSYHLKDASRQQELPLTDVTPLPAPADSE